MRPRLSSLGLSPTRENEIVDELSQHLDDRYQELMVGGASPEEATQLTLADFRDGNLLAGRLAALRQAHVPPTITPAASTGHLLRDVWQEVRYAVRTLRKEASFAVTALTMLALGVGATTAIISIAYTVLLRPLPYPDAERLVYLAAIDTLQPHLIELARQRGLNWAGLSDNKERERVVDEILHE